jgi:hypothetical protein
MTKLFHIFHSVHYSSNSTTEAKKCIQSYYSYNNIIKTTNSYLFRALVAHHHGIQ